MSQMTLSIRIGLLLVKLYQVTETVLVNRIGFLEKFKLDLVQGFDFLMVVWKLVNLLKVSSAQWLDRLGPLVLNNLDRFSFWNYLRLFTEIYRNLGLSFLILYDVYYALVSILRLGIWIFVLIDKIKVLKDRTVIHNSFRLLLLLQGLLLLPASGLPFPVVRVLSGSCHYSQKVPKLNQIKILNSIKIITFFGLFWIPFFHWIRFGFSHHFLRRLLWSDPSFLYTLGRVSLGRLGSLWKPPRQRSVGSPIGTECSFGSWLHPRLPWKNKAQFLAR